MPASHPKDSLVLSISILSSTVKAEYEVWGLVDFLSNPLDDKLNLDPLLALFIYL